MSPVFAQQRAIGVMFLVSHGVLDFFFKLHETLNIGAGIGTRPTTDTGNDLIDAIVWVKPPGESDGTSDPTAERYDSREPISPRFFQLSI